MKIAAKTQYGLRFMVVLGAQYGRRIVQLREIAEKEKVSEKYLEQIVRILKTQKLVKAQRGSQGGYTLTRDPKKITLKDIIEVLEGSLTPVDCFEKDNICELKELCVTIDIWKKFAKHIKNFFENITLEQLVQSYNKKHKVCKTKKEVPV
ncbi:RrF2 family transcriptional regulator [Candidatus Margulisiibacteriota bacterium]